ncbi:hypothetical protein CEXT_401661 [Caerostris extrusa]|uniref:Uncharacterized protein n=1 Tax=Caerostris extrusa TaxID=172846 RepID=A0AAV4M6W9_CAEEX|nr:hypothetical protein CEXT_401661 [Caerostris extrusa]
MSRMRHDRVIPCPTSLEVNATTRLPRRFTFLCRIHGGGELSIAALSLIERWLALSRGRPSVIHFYLFASIQPLNKGRRSSLTLG